MPSRAQSWSVSAGAAALLLLFGGQTTFADADYTVLPSDTDGQPGLADCTDDPLDAIGCEDTWGELANNHEHFLYLPSSSAQTSQGKLLVFLCGGTGTARTCENVLPVAAQQGYHVIGLTYPAGKTNGCGGEPTRRDRLACYGDFMTETITGSCPTSVPSPGCERTNVSEHRQDSVISRLVSVLEWAEARPGDDGWGGYLTSTGEVDWSRVNLAGHSNGAGHVSIMSTLYPSVARVALFAAPNDGDGGTTEDAWTPADYIHRVEGITDTRYYGLIHELNHADNHPDEPPPVYQVTKAWHTFGMEELPHPPRKEFDPDPANTTMDFGGSHMLISTDPLPDPTTDPPTPGTTPVEAHNSVVKDDYCTLIGDDPDDDDPDKRKCLEVGGGPLGYGPAWRCILGTGDVGVGVNPVADAGPDQTLECQGGGGAEVTLDGSGSRDADCDVMSYDWTGPFGQAAGWNATVFVPVGASTVSLAVSDPWSTSAPDATVVTVRDTRPPSLQVSLTPASLWPPDHRLVRVEAAISAADSCGDAPPQVVLTSVTSDQPDNGVADGDTDNDIQDAALDSFDGSVLLRAERAGNDPRGRTYTVTYTATDASGNQTQASATVHVPHSQ